MEEWKQIHYANTNQAKVELANLILDEYFSEQKILPGIKRFTL